MTKLKLIHQLNENQELQLVQLYQEGWWSKGRDQQVTRKILKNSSKIFALVDSSNSLVAFSRVLTDYFKFLYIYDVLVFKKHRKKQIGTQLISAITEDSEFQHIDNMELVCRPELVQFYQRFGFTKEYGASLPMILRRKPHAGLENLPLDLLEVDS